MTRRSKMEMSLRVMERYVGILMGVLGSQREVVGLNEYSQGHSCEENLSQHCHTAVVVVANQPQLCHVKRSSQNHRRIIVLDKILIPGKHT